MVCLVGAAALLGTTTVQAQTRVAIAGPSGVGSEHVLPALEGAIAGDARFELVPAQEVRDAAAEGGADPASLAERLVAFVISGHLRRVGRDFVATLILTNALGERQSTATFRGRNLGMLGSAMRRAPDRLFEGVDIAPVEPPAPGEVQEEPRFEEPTPSSPPEDSPLFGPAEGEAGDEDEDEDEDDYEDAEDHEDAPPTVLEGIRIAARVGFLRRNMSTMVIVDGEFRSMDPNATVEEDRSYRLPGLGQPHIGLELDIFPGALLEEPVIPWIGARFRLGGAPWLKTRALACELEPRCALPPGPVDVPTKQRTIDASLVARYAFSGGHAIGAEVGFGTFAFRLDIPTVAQLTRRAILPSVIYRHLRLGLEGRVVIVPEHFEAALRVAYLLGTSLGVDARSMWGMDSSALGGVDLGMTLTTPLSMVMDGLTLGLYFDLTLLRARYRGQTSCGFADQALCTNDALWEPWPASDGFRGTMIDGGVPDDVADLYVRYGLEIGYRFGGGTRSSRDDDDDYEDEDRDDDYEDEDRDDDYDYEDDREQEAYEEPADAPAGNWYEPEDDSDEDPPPAEDGDTEDLPPPLF